MHRRQWLVQTAAWGAGTLGLAEPRLALGEEGLLQEPDAEPGLDLATLVSGPLGAVCKTVAGETAQLTVEPKLQQYAADLLRMAHPVAGAAIIVDAKTGRLLCFQNYLRSRQETSNPLLTGVPAASVFKLVTATALLDGGKVDPKTRVCFSGGERQIERHHLEAPRGTSACPPFHTALGFSRNAVFAQLATQHLTRRELLEKAEGLGFNRDLPFDASATVGTLDLPYNDLEFARAAAGFLGSDLTPLGAAHLALAIANQGRPRRMRLVTDIGGRPVGQEPLHLPRVMSATTAWRLTRMMEVTVHSGTSLEAFSRPEPPAQSYLGAIRVAGKTGTLQRGKSAPTTSWFTGFAPSRDPKVVVTVMLQNSTLWRRKANEVARDLLRIVFAGARGVTHPFESPLPAARVESQLLEE